MPSEILVKIYILRTIKSALPLLFNLILLCFTQSQARHWFSLRGQFLITFNNFRLI